MHRLQDVLPFKDETFVFLSGVIGCLLALTFLFVLFSLFLRLWNNARAARRKRQEDRWLWALFAVIDGREPVHGLLKLVGRRQRMEFVNFLLQYALRIRGEEQRVLVRLARPFLGEVAQFLRKGSPERRAWAVQVLNLFGLPEYGELLVRALDDPSPFVAMIAARALAQKGHARYVPILLERLDRFEKWRLDFLASVLSNIESSQAPALRSVLANSGKPSRVRAIAAEALRRLNDVDAADVAARILEHEADLDLLLACLRLLERAGHPQHRDTVHRLCQSEKPTVRVHALAALAALGNATDTSVFLAALEDPSPWVAVQAAKGLKDTGEFEALQQFALSKHPRASAAQEALAS